MRIKMYIYGHARYALLLKEEANVLGAVCVEAFLACGRFDRKHRGTWFGVHC